MKDEYLNIETCFKGVKQAKRVLFGVKLYAGSAALLTAGISAEHIMSGGEPIIPAIATLTMSTLGYLAVGAMETNLDSAEQLLDDSISADISKDPEFFGFEPPETI